MEEVLDLVQLLQPAAAEEEHITVKQHNRGAPAAVVVAKDLARIRVAAVEVLAVKGLDLQ
jgi:hypothetical protein